MAIPAPIIAQGLFQEAFTNILADGSDRLSPILYIPSSKGQYAVPTDDNIIGTRVNGFDPKAPVSRSAEAREVKMGYDYRSTGFDKYYEKVVLDDMTLKDLEVGAGIDGVEKAVKRLAALHADRFQWHVADFYQDAGNYAAGQGNVALTLNLTSPNPATVQAALRNAVNQVVSSNGDEVNVNIVAGTSVISALQVLLSRDTRWTLGPEELQKELSSIVGANVNLVAPRSRYFDNAGAGATFTRVAMWSANSLMVTATGINPGDSIGFALTPAFDQYEGGIEGENRFTRIKMRDIPEPDGVAVLGESWYRVEGGVDDRGVKFAVTIS